MGIDTMEELDYLALVLCVDFVRTGSLKTTVTVRAATDPIIYPINAPKAGVNGQTYHSNINFGS